MSLAYRITLLLLVLTLVPAKTPRGSDAPGDSLARRIDALEASLDECGNPDSVRFELALAWRDSGTLEGRLKAINLLEKIRHTYFDEHRYMLELAQTYLACGRRMDGRELLLKLSVLEPESVSIRLTITDLLIREMLRYSDAHDLDVALRVLDEVLGIEPGNSDALHRKSLCLHLARADGRDLMKKSREGRGYSEQVIRTRPEDAQARLLNAVHCVHLGDYTDADYWFKQGIARLPPDAASRFLIPPALEARRGKTILQTDRQLVGKFWDAMDPTPLTIFNETLLRYWYNLVLADIYFGDLAKGTRGWETAPGRAVALFGPPTHAEFEHGRFGGGEGGDAPRMDPAWRRSALPFEPPRITIRYPSGLSLSFVDHTHQGDWTAEGATASVLDQQVRRGLPVALPVLPGGISRIYASHVSSRFDEEKSQEGCVVCIPPWDRRKEWWKDSVVTLSILDSQVQEIARIDHLVDERDLHEISPGREVILFGKDFHASPGSYDLTIRISQNDGERSGTRSLPIHVERFDTERFQLSDIEPVCSGTFRQNESVLRNPSRPYLPDPTSTVNANGDLDVAYAIYNLARNRQGTARYSVRYVIVPLEYRREYERLIGEGSATAEDSLRFGRLGDRLGGIVLSEKNRQEVQFFPVEVPHARAGAVIRKMATLHVADQPDGLYALRITVVDEVTGGSAQMEIPFQKVSDAARESMLSPEPRD